MTITWTQLGMVLLGAIATALYNRGTQSAATPSTRPLLNRILGGGQTSSATAPAGHPIIDSIVSVLESTIAQNPQLAQLEGAVVTLLHPNGNVNLSLTKGGSNVAPTPQTSAQPAAPVPASVASGS